MNGTTGQNNVTVAPSAVDAALITGLATPINVTQTEHLVYNGQRGNDNLTYMTPTGGHLVTLDDGPLADIGTISARAFGGTEILGLSFREIGFTDLVGPTGTVRFADAGGVRIDELVINASDPANLDALITVNVAGTISLDSPIGPGSTDELIDVLTPGVTRLRLNTFDGDDEFTIFGNHPFVGGIFIVAGDPSASDTVNFNGLGTAITVDLGASTVQQTGFGAVTLSGVEILNANAGTFNATYIATNGDNTVDVTPTGADAVTVRLLDSNPAIGATPTVNFSNVGATMTVNGLGGVNGLIFNGTANVDTFNLTRGFGGQTLELVGRQVVTTTTASFDSWTVKGGDNEDTFNINDAVGIDSIELNIDGGSGVANTINYFSDDHVTYVPGNTPTAGQFHLLPFFGHAFDVNFANINVANVDLTGNTIATVDAGGGANQITAAGTAANSVRVTVDNGTQVNFIDLTVLNLNGNAGDDVFAVTPNTLAITAINVAGGDPTANSDTLIVTATTGNDTIGYLPSNTIGSGQVTRTGVATVNFTTIEAVTIDGQGGTDALTHTTPAGTHQVTYTPGAAPDTGVIATRAAAPAPAWFR